MRDKILKIEAELNQTYLERREVVRGLLVGLLARQHVLLLGPPGTAKSALAEDICSRIGGKYFRWLLARTSTPEELFGPVSLKALENDSYRRVTSGKLPEADIAFLDEIWKCNSAVLNTLLTVANERLFFNDGAPVQVPLQMLVGASNELPEDREELGALWDRFLLRYVVSYVKDPRSFEKLLAGQSAGSLVGKHPAAGDVHQHQRAAGVVLVFDKTDLDFSLYLHLFQKFADGFPRHVQQQFIFQRLLALSRRAGFCRRSWDGRAKPLRSDWARGIGDGFNWLRLGGNGFNHHADARLPGADAEQAPIALVQDFDFHRLSGQRQFHQTLFDRFFDGGSNYL